MLLPALVGGFDDSESDAAAETAVITDYTTDFEVRAAGRMIPNRDPRRRFPAVHARNLPSTERGGRHVVAEIGKGDVSISGSHRYVMTYDIDGVLSPPLNGACGSQFYWNLIPGGWRLPITRATLRVTTPSPPQDTAARPGRARTPSVRRRPRATPWR